jgi:hypothetical protein
MQEMKIIIYEGGTKIGKRAQNIFTTLIETESKRNGLHENIEVGFVSGLIIPATVLKNYITI